jgi:hypothetical protein
MSAIINSFIAEDGVPAIGLTPTLRIWEVDDVSETLVVTDASMTEVGDGFYKYVFVGHDVNNKYVTRVDGGVTLNAHSRFYVGELSACTMDEEAVDSIANGIWDEPLTDHLSADSTGEALNMIKNDTTQLRVDVATALSIVTELLKYEANRTRIDKTAKTLTVYDDDGVTPLKVFTLRNGLGNPDVEEVCERDPM